MVSYRPKTTDRPYLRNLVKKGMLDTKEIDEHTRFYNRAQVEALRVKQYKKGE